MSKIQLNDNIMDIMLKMSNGNPGALNVLTELLIPENEKIDPDNIMGGMGNLLSLDTIGIYGADIHVLANDICDGDMIKVITILRAHQFGYLDGDLLRDACSRQDKAGRQMINVNSLYKKVKKKLPRFADLN